MKKSLLFLIVFAFLFVSGSNVSAAEPVAGLFNIDTQTLLSDNSAEILINRDNSTDALTGGPTITQGDIIVTITGITTIGPTTIGSGTAYNEVTVFSALKIADSNDVDLGPGGPDDSFGTQNIDLYEYTAVPLDVGDTVYFDWATGTIDLDADGTPEYTFTPIPGTHNNGELFGFVYEDAAQNYTRNSGIQAGITSATDGTLRLTVAIDPANFDFLSVRAPLDLSAFATLPYATAIDNTNISLDGTIIAQDWAPLHFNDNFTGGNGGFSSPEANSGWPVFDNLDFTITVVPEEEPGKCRMTGGQNRVIPVVGLDGLNTWGYEFENLDGDYFVTTGGQIGAPSGGEPRGHWTHVLHSDPKIGSFTFHSGTTSAPEGTEISTIECADPGWCVQARCAPFKQIFWTGIGNFHWKDFDADLGGCVSADKKNPSLHYYRAMVGDFGENDRPTREDALVDENPETCDWFAKLQAAGWVGPPGPFDASTAVFLDSEPDEQFGYKGGQVCDKCPDYYQIEIHCTTDPNSPIIYQFSGFISGGNYQIHPETGEQCPVTEELVPELFESTKKVPPVQLN